MARKRGSDESGTGDQPPQKKQNQGLEVLHEFRAKYNKYPRQLKPVDLLSMFHGISVFQWQLPESQTLLNTMLLPSFFTHQLALFKHLDLRRQEILKASKEKLLKKKVGIKAGILALRVLGKKLQEAGTEAEETYEAALKMEVMLINRYISSVGKRTLMDEAAIEADYVEGLRELGAA
ncbi:uncharacterized protein AB675_1422 [Cyphellophora attinorum]|uniref:Uncharacterized protein n=1 Tax=Cyphellophora attinorum TaxID=1664694 RepID=A0A0N1H0I0_9EURO|nr:uncharacterized protein AB675_1422 [Phialophora attinorum]KPI37242.1 hypothetical protein AB675_1422 [Phialophora attinorum]